MSKDISKQSFPLNKIDLLDSIMISAGFVITILSSIFIVIIKAIFGIQSFSTLIGISSDLLTIIYEYFAATFILLIAYIILRRHRLTLIDFGFRQISFINLLVYVLFSFIITFIAWIIIAPVIIYIFPSINLEQSQEIFMPGMSIVVQILVVLYAVIIGPFLEEIVFRGILLPSISNKWNLAIGIIFSTIIWSLLHFQLNVIIFTSIFGIILSYIYYKSQSLWPCYITHVLKNLIAVIFIYAIGFV